MKTGSIIAIGTIAVAGLAVAGYFAYRALKPVDESKKAASKTVTIVDFSTLTGKGARQK